MPSVSDAARAANPEYYSGNVWPTVPSMAEFAPAFKTLGRIVADVGLALAHACDVASFVPHSNIRDMIANSQSNKARLLHYYPQVGSGGDDACGLHIDHSILTGLCSAMYFDDRGEVVAAPSDKAGLFIYPRGESEVPVKVSIPADCLGEHIERDTAGSLG